ncbi:hypothetical protein ACFV0R_25720 [Streptomyces sp. NPDC059578]|uniref:hypothetical protein n=1 Tax=Streptomyces sp. NPDC059578 TaxID=3346874 RepID=UPI0036AB5CBA
MPISRKRLNAEADYLENVAIPRTAAAARDAARDAADPANSPQRQRVAAAAERNARAWVADFQNFAETLRAGEIPDGMDLT